MSLFEDFYSEDALTTKLGFQS